MSWQKTVDRLVMEARVVLAKEYGCPDTLDALVSSLKTYQPVDRCSTEAVQVISCYKKLCKYVDAGMLLPALDKITQLYGHSEQVWFYSELLNEPRKTGMKPIRETYFIEGCPDYSLGDLLRRGQVQQRSAQEAAIKSHKENHQFKGDAIKIWQKGDFSSYAEGARFIETQMPIKFRTARDWISQYEKSLLT